MVVGGFALLELLVTPDGKRVFLFVVANTSNAMLRMTTTAIMVQKSGRRPFKKSAFGGKKSLIPKFIMAKYGLIQKSFLWIYALIPKSFVAKFGLIPKSLGCLPTAGNAFG